MNQLEGRKIYNPSSQTLKTESKPQQQKNLINRRKFNFRKKLLGKRDAKFPKEFSRSMENEKIEKRGTRFEKFERRKAQKRGEEFGTHKKKENEKKELRQQIMRFKKIKRESRESGRNRGPDEVFVETSVSSEIRGNFPKMSGTIRRKCVESLGITDFGKEKEKMPQMRSDSEKEKEEDGK